MSEQASLKLKENIDTAEDRYHDAEASKLEADERLEKAQEEWETYRRRIKLLEFDIEKSKKTLAEKQERLAHLEGRTEDDDEKRQEYEGVEIERDDQLRTLENRDNEAAEREFEEKLRFLEEQLKEAVARAESAERDVVRNENIVTSVKLDLQAWKDKRAYVDKEMERIYEKWEEFDA